MKALYTFLLLLFCTSAFAQYTIKTDSVYITGKVANFERYKDSANSVQIIVNDILLHDQITYRSRINNDGTYRLAFFKIGMQDVYIEYNDDLQTIIVTPGYHMQIDFDAADFESSLAFKGDGAQVNRDLMAYEAAKDKENKRVYGGNEYGRFRAQSASEKDNLPAAHQKFLAERLAKEKQFLQSFIKQHKPALAFISWKTNDLQFEYYGNLMRYVWLHPMYNQQNPNDFKIPDSYYAFTKNISLNNPSLASSSNYNEYLYGYANYTREKEFGNKAEVGVLLNFLGKQPGFAADIMLSNEMYAFIKAKHLEIVETHLAKYKKLTTNKVLKNQIAMLYQQAADQQNNYTLPASAQINQTPKTEADSLFTKLVAKYPNKVIYVDFWATWCGPCRAEMPNSAKLREKYAGKDVVFLYLGLQSEEKAWKAMIAELDIQGEHYLLNKNEYAVFADKFKIGGIPHYVLIGKNGLVVDGNAKRPSNEELKTEVDKLLGGK